MLDAEARDPMARQRWSPYAAGAGLGLLVTLSLWLAGHPIGASSTFLVWAGNILRGLQLPLAQNLYFAQVVQKGWTWQTTLLVGAALGGLLSAKASGSFRWELVPAGWRLEFGPSVCKRWLAAFIGGMLIEFGAGLAGGCTSGLAIGGAAQLAPSAFLFIAAMFGAGLVTARLIFGRDGPCWAR